VCSPSSYCIRCPPAQGPPKSFATTLSTSYTTGQTHSRRVSSFPNRGPPEAFNGDPDVVAWQNAFPDPSNSPAYHVLTLIVNHRRGFLENHLSSFCNVTRLFLHVHPANGYLISLTQLHGFTPFLKSLHMTFPILPSSDVLSLVHSFPILDDLLLTGIPMASDTKVTPLTPPTLHFREVILPWICDKDLPSTMDLILACSNTLESLHVLDHTKRTSSRLLLWILWRFTMLAEGNTRHFFDLSSAVNLKSVVFRCGMPSINVDWITAAVENIKSSHVKEMALHMPKDLTTREKIDSQPPGRVYTQWRTLDKVLVKCLTARSFKLRVVAPPGASNDTFGACVERLLPNLFGKKMLEVAEIGQTF